MSFLTLNLNTERQIIVKTITQTYRKSKDCKHSVVFTPVGTDPNTNPEIASSVYISRQVLLPGCTEIQLTLTQNGATEPVAASDLVG